MQPLNLEQPVGRRSERSCRVTCPCRRKQLEEENQALHSQQSQLQQEVGQLKGQVDTHWNDILSAATADKDALKKYLGSHPEWLEQRKEEVRWRGAV